MKKGKKKKSFLDNQKKHKRETKRSAKDPNAKEEKDETRFKFQNFSDQVASVEASIVYQLGGIGAIQVCEKFSKIAVSFLFLIHKG